jgi:transposase-like protein
VTAKAERRQYSVEYKLRILAEADAATERGEIGAMLRREGLHTSMWDKWRKQRERGVLQALTPQKRGPKVDMQQVELERLRRENEQLQKQLQRAETIIEIQKKLAGLLGEEASKPEKRNERALVR